MKLVSSYTQVPAGALLEQLVKVTPPGSFPLESPQVGRCKHTRHKHISTSFCKQLTRCNLHKLRTRLTAHTIVISAWALLENAVPHKPGLGHLPGAHSMDPCADIVIVKAVLDSPHSSCSELHPGRLPQCHSCGPNHWQHSECKRRSWCSYRLPSGTAVSRKHRKSQK